MADDRPASDSSRGAPAEDLDHFVARRLERIRADLPEPGGELTAAMQAEVATLYHLSQLRRFIQPKKSKQRYLMPALCLLTLVVITALVFLRIQTVRVLMDVTASAVTFKTRGVVQLSGLSSLQMLQGLTFAATELEPPKSSALAVAAPLELRVLDGGSLTLSSITIPAGTRVGINKTADPGTWRIEIDNPNASVRATLKNAVRVATPSVSASSFDFGRGTPVLLQADQGMGRLELDVTPSDSSTFLVTRTLEVSDLAFEESFEEPTEGSAGVVGGRASSIVGGSIFDESLGGRESRLLPHERMNVDIVNGQITDLRLDTAAVHVSSLATARELALGGDSGLRSLRPSYLEWLTEYHGLQLLWGAGAWLFALLLGGVKWWQDTHDSRS